jgi:hypothetical protein
MRCSQGAFDTPGYLASQKIFMNMMTDKNDINRKKFEGKVVYLICNPSN